MRFGLPKFRKGLARLEPVTKEKAGEIIDLVDEYGAKCLEKYGTRMFFCADEFYIKAERPLPDEEYYEEYQQLDNGVGMLLRRQAEELFKYEFLVIDQGKLIDTSPEMEIGQMKEFQFRPPALYYDFILPLRFSLFNLFPVFRRECGKGQKDSGWFSAGVFCYIV